MAEDPKPQGGTENEDVDVDAPELTPEQIEAAQRDKKLAEENAKHRIANKKLRQELDEIKTKNAEMEAKWAEIETIKADLAAAKEAAADKKTATTHQADQEVLKLRKELADAQKAATELARKSQDEVSTLKLNLKSKAHRAAIQALIADAGILEPASAAELLERKTKYNEETEQVVTVVRDEDGEEVEVPLKGKDALKKTSLLPGIYWPAEGVPGAGSRAPGAGGKGVDVDRILSNQSLFEKDKEKIRAELRKNQAGNR